jgi:hypothetical protein
MFRDFEFIPERVDAQRYSFMKWLHDDTVKRRLCCIEIGAGTQIDTIRKTTRMLVDGYGATLIRINPEESEVEHAGEVSIPLGALDAINQINTALLRSF